MRVACYARYSSDLQRETSIDDQLGVARRFATDRGWKVLKDHLYTDSAISGASINGRAGVQRLLAAAAQQPKPFDVLLVDDSSRISRDIADAIRVMQQLKFFGIRVIYISQGIDSDSEQADALVAVHGLIDSMYLKELAKKVKRGLAGQMDRGFSTGARQYGYDKVPVIDPSGRKDVDGHPLVLGKEIRTNEDEARVIRRIFEMAADGVGCATIVDRLNREGVPGTGGQRWSNTPVGRILSNERYLGRQIWGQQGVEREPSTGRRIMRNRPRTEWKVRERPELRIISDDLWNRTQATRSEIRQAVASTGNLARGKRGRYHSTHLFTGFAKCALCGGAIGSVSGGKGSPRFGCTRSWQNGTSTCANRLTIRIKVAEPQILAKLQVQLLEPETLAFITKAVEKEARRALSDDPSRNDVSRKRLDLERRKLQNLVTALEGGSSVPAAILKAISEREATIAQIEREVRAVSREGPSRALEDVSGWVEAQLGDLATLLKTDVPRVKAEFRRLNLQLTFGPVEAKPRPHYIVKGQCDLSALVFSFVRRDRITTLRHRAEGAPEALSAGLDLMGASPARGRSWWHGRFTS